MSERTTEHVYQLQLVANGTDDRFLLEMPECFEQFLRAREKGPASDAYGEPIVWLNKLPLCRYKLVVAQSWGDRDDFIPGRIAFYVSADDVASFASLLDLFLLWRSWMSGCEPTIHVYPDITVDENIVDTCFRQLQYQPHVLHDLGTPMPLHPFNAQPCIGLTHMKMRIIQETCTSVSIVWQGAVSPYENAVKKHGVRGTYAASVWPASDYAHNYALLLQHYDVVENPRKLHDIIVDFGNVATRVFVDTKPPVKPAVAAWLEQIENELPCLYFEERRRAAGSE